MDEKYVAHTCAVGSRDGNVVLEFPANISYASFDPGTALRIGESIAKEAYYLKTGIREKEASVIANQKRGRMAQRVVHIFNSMNRKKQTPQYIAQQIVDTILAELY